MPGKGIVLVFVAGFLALVTILASVFAIGSATMRQTVGTRSARASAARAAQDALAYAESRLWEDPRSAGDKGLLLTPANARDDWTARGKEPPSASPAALLNPSYARGDVWKDADANGAFTLAPTGDTWRDQDGDGRFTVRSGRLRGGREFALRITPASALACVNSGETGSPTGDHDLDGILNGADTAYAPYGVSGPYREDLDAGYFDSDNGGSGNGMINLCDPSYAGPLGNGIPDWCDPDFFGNQHIVNLLDNLGAILALSTTRTVPYAPGYPQLGEIRTSTLGRDIVASRPRGGYASVEDLRGVLAPEDFRKAAPFLSARGDVVPVPFAVPVWPVQPTDTLHFGALAKQANSPEPFYAFAARLDFNCAPLELLRASLRNLTAAAAIGSNMTMQTTTQMPFIRLTRDRSGKDEADGIAAVLEKARPIRTWKDFLRILVIRGSGAWVDDPFTTDDDRLPARARLKQDLILAQAAPAHFADPLSWRANTLEIAREAGTPQDPVVGMDATASRLILKRALTGPFSSLPYDKTGTPATQLDLSFALRWNGSYQTVEYSLGGIPADFVVACDGIRSAAGSTSRVVAGAVGELSTGGGTLHLTSQQDFEMLSTSLRPVDPAHPWLLAEGAVRSEGGPPQKNGIQTGPRFPFGSYDPFSTDPVKGMGYPGGALDNWVARNCGYPRQFGFLELTPRQWTAEELGGPDDPTTQALPAQVAFALPFNEDRFDPANPVNPEPGTWYDNQDYRDNLGDPVADPANPAKSRGPALSGDTTGVQKRLHEGFLMGPGGPRLPAATSGLASNLSVLWDDVLFPLPREDYPSNPPVRRGGKIVQGTVAGWIHACGGDVPGPETLQIRALALQYDRKIAQDHSWTSLVGLTFQLDDHVRVQTLSPSGSADIQTVPPPSDPALAAASWHHFALVFDGSAFLGDPDRTAMSFYLDGVKFPYRFNVCFEIFNTNNGPPCSPQMKMDFSTALSPDDLFFYGASLGEPEIRRMAAEPRHAPTGTYTSPRFIFDEALLPDGATIRGVSWDAFIPEQTDGKVHLGVTGWDDAGNPAGSAVGGAWDGNGSSPSLVCDIIGCRSCAFTVTMTTDSKLLMDDGSGNKAPALRDTPRVDAISIHYTGRPRWTGLAER